MEEIQTEKGVLMRTLELLNARFQQLKDNIVGFKKFQILQYNKIIG